MTTLACVFLVWALVASAYWATTRATYVSYRRLFLDERRAHAKNVEAAEDEHALRVWREAQLLDAHTRACAYQEMLARVVVSDLKRAAGARNWKHLQLVAQSLPGLTEDSPGPGVVMDVRTTTFGQEPA